MKSDNKGCSSCAPGEESYEKFKVGKKTRVQYDYRTPDGKLFSTVAPTLIACRSRRDAWLAAHQRTNFFSKEI